jgi:hypothetical protein
VYKLQGQGSHADALKIGVACAMGGFCRTAVAVVGMIGPPKCHGKDTTVVPSGKHSHFTSFYYGKIHHAINR